ncbi:MAG: BA14K family protein [Rhizobiales bacterium]|nr:BA14K family protein [Hyphomicrobiales bacterium]
MARYVVRKLPLAAFALLSLSAGLVQAAPKDYCDAYARDFADRGPKDEAQWKSRRANAFNDCLLQFGSGAVAVDTEAPAAKPAKKPVKAAGAKARQKPVPAPVQEAETLPEPAVIVAPDIEPPPKRNQQAEQTTKAAPSKSKTLLGKLFKPKDESETGNGGQNAQTAQAAPASLKGKLVPGSAAWLDYCDRKYASFNRDTGTYKSYKGIERKCLVTD